MSDASPTSRPQVSVIIPAYNAAKTIRAALRSLDSQLFRDFETIVVDDGSKDDTAAIVRNEFPQVRLVTQANGGCAAARNRGIAEATGVWLAFLDADDEFLPWRLSLQMEYAARYPEIDLWSGLSIGIDDPLPTLDSNPGLTTFTLRDFAVYNPVCLCTTLIKTSVLRALGGFESEFRSAEDYLMWIRVAGAGQIARIEAPLSRYFEGTGTLSMDERKFLPIVLEVIAKLYGPGGALRSVGRPALARAYQYCSGSWMAYRRGDLKAARALLFRSLATWPFPLPLKGKPSAVRFRRLARYLRYNPT